MSGKERSKEGGDDVEEFIHEEDPKKQRGHGRRVGKAKQVLLFQFSRIKRLYRKRSSSATNPGQSGCYLCFMKPLTLDSPAASHTSDPNNPDFSYEFLKALIETNDFYSSECNVHRNIPHTQLNMESSSVNFKVQGASSC